MAYVTSDKVNFSTCKLKYAPYLHEKKIYLNRIKTNTSYFYTSISTTIGKNDKSYEQKTIDAN